MPRWGEHIGGRKNHIKYAFLLKDSAKLKFYKSSELMKYLFAYLTDDNKIFFDEIYVKEPNLVKKTTLRKFLKKVKLHYLDSRTQVYYYFGEKKDTANDMLFMLWKLYHLGMKFNMTRVPLGITLNKLNRFFSLGFKNFKDPRTVSYVKAIIRMYEIYDIILKNHVCPWINDEFNQRISLIRTSRRRMYIAVTLGLLHLVVKDIKR